MDLIPSKVDGENSDALRILGNAAFVARNYTGAINYYLRSANAAPEDVRPVFSVSTSYYELGNYTLASEYAAQSLLLCGSGCEEMRVNSLLLIAKCKLYQKDIQQLRETLKRIPERIVKREMAMASKFPQGIALLKALEKGHWKKIIRLLPRNLPSMQEDFLATIFGCDFAISQFDDKLNHEADHAGRRDYTSILFGEIGDARHLFATLLVPSGQQKLHITCTDTRPIVVARLLVILYIMYDLGTVTYEESTPYFFKIPDTQEETECLTSLLLYLYMGAIMPRYAYQKFQEYVRRIIQVLQRKVGLFPWIYIYRKDVSAILYVLEQWQNPPGDAWSTETVRRQAMATAPKWPNLTTITLLLEERAFWSKTGVILPPPLMLQKHEPLMASHAKNLKALVGRKKRTTIAKIGKHVDQEWFPNLTIFGSNDLTAFDWDPFSSLLYRFNRSHYDRNKWPDHLYSYAVMTFGAYSKAVYGLSVSLVVELTISDAIQQMDELHHFGTYPHRESKDLQSKDIEKLPSRYDRIHLSSIPDCTGGPLPAFIYAFSCSRVDRPTSYVTFNIELEDCAHEQSTFLDSYFTHHLGLPHDSTSLAAVANAVIVKAPTGPMSYREHLYWRRQNSAQLPYEKLLSQSDLEFWFYDLFFNMIIPCKRDFTDLDSIIYQTLNTTFIFRLIIYLHQIGYPSHWLSSILTSLLSGHITTQARPPKIYPRPPQKTRQWPARRMSILPISHEMNIMAAMFSSVIPFGFATKAPLPSVDDLYKFSVQWSKSGIVPCPDSAPHYFIALMDLGFMMKCQFSSCIEIRDMILDDESWTGDVHSKNFRDKGLVIITVFEFEGLEGAVSSGATFWFSKLRMEIMSKTGLWRAALMRNDNWGFWAFSDPFPGNVKGLGAYFSGKSWEETEIEIQSC